MESGRSEQTCRLCTRDVSESAAAIHLYSADSVERGVADRMADLLEVPLEKTDGLGSYVCELCNARFKHLVRSLEVHRLNAKKNYEKQAKKAGIYVETLEDMMEESATKPVVEDAKDPNKDPLVQAADMTGMDLGSLLSDLVAAKKKMREKKGGATDRKVVTEDIKDLMNLLSGIRKEDVFVFGVFLGIPDSRLKDIEQNYSDNHQRYLTEVVMAWINACPESSTWSTLVEALNEVGHRKSAQEVAERRGIVLPGVMEDSQLWGALKALIPINEGGDLVTLLQETEKLRVDVKTKDALLVQSEVQLGEINSQKDEFEKQYNDTLQELEEKKQLLEEEKRKAQKTLQEKEAELRKLRAERATKEEIETKEIEIMYLKKKVQQHQTTEKELMTKIIDLQEKLEATDIGKLDWIASNLEKQLEGVRPEFERERSHMMNNIYKMLKYIKIPDDLPDSDEEGGRDSEDPATVPPENVENEELRGEGLDEEGDSEKPKTPEPEPADLESLLSTLKSPTEASSAISMFEDKEFMEEDYPLAVRLFEDTPPFLLSQILGLRMEEWLAIEAVDKKDDEKQRGSVLQTWGRSRGDSAKWSVLAEALIILGLRGKAQIAFMEKGVPLPDAGEDGPLWSSLKNTLLTGDQAVQEMLVEMEAHLVEVKRKDDEMCARETVLDQARTEGELISTSLKRVKQDLARKVLQCKSLEVKMGKTSPGTSSEEDSPEGGGEVEELRSRHREHIEAVQSLWKEQEAKKTEYESHVARLEPREREMNQMRTEFAAQRSWLVGRLEEMYDLFTGREKPVETEKTLMEEEGAEEDGETAEVFEEIEQQTTPEPEPADLESLLSYLTSPTASAISMFEDKEFMEEDYPLAVRLFEDTPPFLLSQILGLRMAEWLVIEAVDKKDDEKQRGSVLQTWGRSRGDSAKWGVLVEALIILGLRGKAQIACIEKGIPLPHVSEDGPLWSSVVKTLLSGNQTVQQMLTEMEGVRVELKMKDDEMCARETVLEQARTEGELISTSLKRAKHDLAREMTQCKTLEGRMGQISPANELFPDDSPEGGGEVEELRSRHREHMEAVQSLWKEQEAKKTEYESHVARLEPREREMNQMRAEFAALRSWLVGRLEEMYELFTGREKPVPKGEANPERPPPPKPKPRVAPAPPPPPPPPPPVTPGGYRAATDQLVPTNDPVLPSGYTIMDLFHPSNTFSLLPGIDPVGRPLTVQGNMLTGIAIKGRGSLNQECGLMSEVAAPFIVTLRIPNRGRLMVDDRRAVYIKNTPYKVGDPAFEFIIRPYKDTKVTFESRKFLKSFLTVDQNAHLSVQEMPPDFSDVQFVVRVQRFVGPYTTQIKCPHGRPSIVNQLKDRSVIQLHSKATGIYLGLRVNGDVVGMTNPDNDKTFLVYCDRGLGRVSLQSYAPPLLKLKMRFNGNLICQGEENLDNDFYLKESPDGTVLFESVPNRGRYVQVTMKNKKSVTIIRNFSIVVLVFVKERGRTATVTKYVLN